MAAGQHLGTEQWPAGTPGLFRLPSGRSVRGRGVGRPMPEGPPPQLAVHLLGRRPPPVPWDSRWVRWPDYLLPLDGARLRAALAEALHRVAQERVEVACYGGVGRTGTALACLAALDGVPADRAVAYVPSIVVQLLLIVPPGGPGLVIPRRCAGVRGMSRQTSRTVTWRRSSGRSGSWTWTRRSNSSTSSRSSMAP